MKVIFSPCLYCNSNELYDLLLLDNILDFIVKYLDAGLDDYDEAFYNDNRLYMPPVMETTSYLQYMSIIKNIYKLKANGDQVTIGSHNNDYLLQNQNFQILNDQEFQVIIDYLYQLYSDDCGESVLMFYGHPNETYDMPLVKILINGIPFSIPVVGNPFLDKTGNFNTYIKDTDNNELFIHKDLCCQLADEMKSKISAG